jgi:hypothetical protein
MVMVVMVLSDVFIIIVQWSILISLFEINTLVNRLIMIVFVGSFYLLLLHFVHLSEFRFRLIKHLLILHVVQDRIILISKAWCDALAPQAIVLVEEHFSIPLQPHYIIPHDLLL